MCPYLKALRQPIDVCGLHDLDGCLIDIYSTSTFSILNIVQKNLKTVSLKKYIFKLLRDSLEDYARKWTKRDIEDTETFEEWIKSVGSLIQIRTSKRKTLMSTKATSFFQRSRCCQNPLYHLWQISCRVMEIQPQIISFYSVQNITSIVKLMLSI